MKDRSSAGLRRVLGPLDATMVVVGSIIGVGIFVMPGRVAERAPDALSVLAVWAAGGVIAAAGALTFASLAKHLPRAGGSYAYLRAAFGPLAGFLYGWASLLTINTGAMALMAKAASYNIAPFLGAARDGGAARGLEIGAILVLTLVNAMGVKRAAAVQTLLALAKLLLLGGLIAAGLSPLGCSAPVVRAVAAQPAWGWTAFTFALLPVLFSYGGWQNACNLAEEVRRPERNVPLAVIAGTLLATAVYLLFNGALLRSLGIGGLERAGPAAASALAERAAGEWGGALVALGIAFSALGVLNGLILGTPRILYAMARDGCFFRGFAVLDPYAAVPRRVLALQASIALLYVLSSDLYQVAEGIVVIDWLFFALAGAAWFRIARTRPLVPGLVAGVFAASAAAIVAIVAWESLTAGTRTAPMALWQLALLAVGAGVYRVAFARRG